MLKTKDPTKIIKVIRGIGIFLVVLGHTGGVEEVLAATAAEIVGNDKLYDAFLQLIKLIYTFHMPLFFFVSGVSYEVLTKSRNYTYRRLIVKKFKRLLVPYLLISSIAFPIKVLLCKFARSPINFDLVAFINHIVIPWDNAIAYYWFLPTLFLIFTITPLLDYFSDKVFPCYLLIAFLLFCYFSFPHMPRSDETGRIFNFYGALHNAIFFYFGILFQRKNLFEKIPILTAVLIVPAILIRIAYVEPNTKFTSLFAAFMGIVTIFSLSEYLFAKSSFFLKLGNFSFQIYLFSWFAQKFIWVVFGQVFFINIWIYIAFSILAGIYFPIITTRILEYSIPTKYYYTFGKLIEKDGESKSS